MGGYKWAYSGAGDIRPGTLDIRTLAKSKPIVRQFDDNFKYNPPNYDYTIYICGTEEDPSSKCCKCFMFYILQVTYETFANLR